MEYLGIQLPDWQAPPLDATFIPLELFSRSFLKTATKPVTIAIRGNEGQLSVWPTRIHGTLAFQLADRYYIDRLVKTLLWQRGGYQILISGDCETAKYLQDQYSPGGSRSFDQTFMEQVFAKPFAVLSKGDHYTFIEQNKAQPLGRNFAGCRIGFDAGGSDRKVSAVIDGRAVFSEEVIWHPKEQKDPAYHYREILTALQTAARHLPRVDGIGVSAAGIYLNNRTRIASLFIKVPDQHLNQDVSDIFLKTAAQLGPDIPVFVCNDGDVSALAGSISMQKNNVLGLAMGTSEAGGYVDRDGRITGWFNELAFIPVDASPAAALDEWSKDIGCGVKYFSQDGVIRLAETAGIPLATELSPAEKLTVVQDLLKQGDLRAQQVFMSIGCYLGHSLPWYHRFYDMEHVLLLGRVVSKEGGEIILNESKQVLNQEYPELKLTVALPDESFRRVGQSVVAASLPIIKKEGC